jgi:lipoate---protein ligase
MIYFENPKYIDPHINLAIEEYLLREIVTDRPIFYFYVNKPSVIVGRNQNVFEEIDFNFLQKQSIPVLRRLSGGGTVYHDLGNINYSLITPDQALLNDYASFTRPVFNALHMVGLTAELRHRSSIFVGGYKVSGNAQYATAGKLVSHGTLLLNTDLNWLRSAIRPRNQQITSRAVPSVRSSVANLSDLIDETISLDVFKDHIRHEFLGSDGVVQYKFSRDDWEVVQKIAKERYHTWDWNIGRSPKFSTLRRTQTPHGEVILELYIDKGYIRSAKATSPSPENDNPLNEMCECLAGIRYDRDEIALALHYCDIDIGSLGLDEATLISLIF